MGWDAQELESSSADTEEPKEENPAAGARFVAHGPRTSRRRRWKLGPRWVWTNSRFMRL